MYILYVLLLEDKSGDFLYFSSCRRVSCLGPNVRFVDGKKNIENRQPNPLKASVFEHDPVKSAG